MTAEEAMEHYGGYSGETVGKVYFIEAVGSSRVKIGWTKEDVEGRKKSLQTGCPFPLAVVRVDAGTYKDEKKFHLRYAKFRIPGTEWFKIKGLLKKYLSR